ncbi:hypothetical protein P350_05165 [Burkholderia cepacia JBK9]|nr:hypothetical protein P350_05165 [Burkholderia cepacia JBK9]
MRACGLRVPFGVDGAGGRDRQADARVGDAYGAVHQIVKAGKDEVLDRRARGGTAVRHRDGAIEVPAREVAATGPAMREMSAKACISMFRQMMFASGSGVHRTLGWRDGFAAACACLSVDEKCAARSRAAPVRSARFARE